MARQAVCSRIIGWVKNDIQQEESRHQWREAVSEIVIEPNYAQDLVSINLYRYIVVLFWMDRVNSVCRGQGSLATCYPYRPNPIGLTFVELIELKGNVLVVKGLDAFDGTPVLDIKPYKPWSFKRIAGDLPDINLVKPT